MACCFLAVFDYRLNNQSVQTGLEKLKKLLECLPRVIFS